MTDITFENLIPFISGWWIIMKAIITTLPWAVVAVWDSIDSKYRSLPQVAFRLLLSSGCLLLAYVSGAAFITVLSVNMFRDKEPGRHDEVATVVVLLIFNLWDIIRDIRGWLQWWAIRKVSPMFTTVQRNIVSNFPGENNEKDSSVQGIKYLRVSERLFDNDIHSVPMFLSPFFTIEAHIDNRFNERWAIAMWHAWWSQETKVEDGFISDLTAPDYYNWQERYTLAPDLLDTKPNLSEPYENVVDRKTGKAIRTRNEWVNALISYGDGGQQDTHGDNLQPTFNMLLAGGIATLVKEKTTRIPNRMCGLWYYSARFEEGYSNKVTEMKKDARLSNILFPEWSNWLKIAQDVSLHLPRPMYLSDAHLVIYAGELASTSVILTFFAEKYSKLVDQIYHDGRHARWTFGWSGLLACFSHLWTKERIFVAMLNGLSLLSLASEEEVENIDRNVRSMLYGYAAFEVSDRAVGKRITKDRHDELLKRYRDNDGKTCRGSGLCAIRLAYDVLNIPAEASHMDGLPAFSTGWCSEYITGQPGNQEPAHGSNHDEVEKLQGSSSAWRFPNSCI